MKYIAVFFLGIMIGAGVLRASIHMSFTEERKDKFAIEKCHLLQQPEGWNDIIIGTADSNFYIDCYIFPRKQKQGWKELDAYVVQDLKVTEAFLNTFR